MAGCEVLYVGSTRADQAMVAQEDAELAALLARVTAAAKDYQAAKAAKAGSAASAAGCASCCRFGNSALR